MSSEMDEKIQGMLQHNPLAFSTGLARSDLGFLRLRGVNVNRCEDVFHPLDAWSMTDWATALAGEVGEFCNIVKKIRRLGGGDQRLDSPEYRDLLAVKAVIELADVVIYADLCAARLHKDLAAAIRWKFNAVSDERGSAIKL